MKLLSALIALAMIVLTVEMGAFTATAADEAHVHTYGTWARHSDTLHVKTCTCGEKEYAHHNWDAGTIGLAPGGDNGAGFGDSSDFGDLTFNPTPSIPGGTGTVMYTCLDCGATYVGAVNSLPTHTYTEYEPLNETQHKHACLCGEYVTGTHTWDGGKVTVEATHTSTGTRVYTCTLCGDTKTETIVKLEAHEWDEGKITTEPTCTTVGVKTYTCTCGETKTEEIFSGEHTYGDWEKHDITNHKKICPCGDVVYEGHGWDEGVTTAEPTHFEEGSKLYTCKTCGETRTESIDVIKHTYSEWAIFDDLLHEHVCECGHTVYAHHAWEAKTASGLYLAGENGVGTGKVMSWEALFSMNGSIADVHYVCAECGIKYTGLLENLPDHSYDGYETLDDENHKLVCKCGAFIAEGHEWDGGTVTKPATPFETGVITHTCLHCGETKTEEIPVDEHDKITNMSVSLGTDISVNCYADLCDAHTGAQMRFTMNGKVQTVVGTLTKDGDYVFVFKGVAPQCMGDMITVELIINGEVLDSKTNFTIRSYCDKMLGMGAERLGLTETKFEALKTLIADMLEYGAKAQLYKGHNTDALVNQGITGKTAFVELNKSDLYITDTSQAGVEFTSVGVYFDYNNSLYVKFTAPGMTEENFYISYKDAMGNVYQYYLNDCELLDAETSTYVLIVAPTMTSQFGELCTLEIYTHRSATDAEFSVQQLLKYNVNSYVYSMQNKMDASGNLTTMAELARALYNYGLSAQAYAATV